MRKLKISLLIILSPIILMFIYNYYMRYNLWDSAFTMDTTNFVIEKEKENELWFYQTKSCKEEGVERIGKANCVKGIKVSNLTSLRPIKNEFQKEAAGHNLNRISSAITKDNSFVWSENHIDNKIQKIYLTKVDIDNNRVDTKLLKETKIFDIDQYYQDIQKGIAAPISSIQNQTGILSYERFKYDPKENTISWVDGMVTEKDNEKPTEVISRLNVLSLESGNVTQVVRERERLDLIKYDKYQDGIYTPMFVDRAKFRESYFGNSKVSMDNILDTSYRDLYDNANRKYSSDFTDLSRSRTVLIDFFGYDCTDDWGIMPCIYLSVENISIKNKIYNTSYTNLDGVLWILPGNAEVHSGTKILDMSQSERYVVIEKNRKTYYVDMKKKRANLLDFTPIGKIHTFE